MGRLPPGTRFASDIPARLDRLPFSKWHGRVVVALGITWMLDGLEVTIVGAIAPVLSERETLHLTEAQIGATASAYLFGAIVGALLFGRLTDTLGRKRLFLVTLCLYLGATLATGLSWSFATFALCRALTGAGIGGEYAAVNSAIDELMPARIRGRADLAINGTYWLGTALGAGATLLLLDARLVPHAVGWRLAFVLGAAIGLSVLLLRSHVPESPRWLLLHGRVDEAERVVRGIEASVSQAIGGELPAAGAPSELEAKGKVTFGSIGRVMMRRHRRRAILGLSLMIAQAFAYNGVFFTYALVLAKFFGIVPWHIGLYLLPFAAGNLFGPLVLGRWFDTVGRRPMIAVTYVVSGALIALTGYGLAHGWFSAASLTAMWCVAFFVASAAASSAYLTTSELFPVELRGMAIALFYALGTAAGGFGAPALFGALVQTGNEREVYEGYLIGAGLMVLAGIIAALFGVPAERKSLERINELEDVAEPRRPALRYGHDAQPHGPGGGAPQPQP